MSVVQSIAQQDRLFQSSIIQNFIHLPLKKTSASSFRKTSLALYPAQVIPKIKIKNDLLKMHSISKQFPSRPTSITSFSKSSLLMPRPDSKFRMSSNPQSFKNAYSSQRNPQSRIKSSFSQRSNSNLDKMNKLIDFNSIKTISNNKKVSIALVRRLSIGCLKAKGKVDAEQIVIRKYQNYCPFEPAYLESEYLK